MLENISTLTLQLYAIVLLLALILLTILVLLIHSGLFRSADEVKTGKPPIGQAIIAYKFRKGPYKEAGQLFTEAAIIAPDNKAIGIYYDDPRQVEPHLLRYAVGSILSEGAESGPVNEEMVKQFTDSDFKILHLPEVTYAVQTKFPHITTLSVFIAPFKAYPSLHEYIQEKKLCAYPFIEYYDGETIHFMAPLSKQEEFFVPECEQDVREDQASTDFDSTGVDTSHSMLDESSVISQDLTQTSVFDTTQSSIGDTTQESVCDTTQTTIDDMSVQDLQDKQKLITSRSDVGAGERQDDDDKDYNTNNSETQSEDVNGADNEDEQISDDSTSSFEVLKPENIGQ